MSEKYHLLIYFIHSRLISFRKELLFNQNTTVENFRKQPCNEAVCDAIFREAIMHFGYELSHNQMCNGINLFLQGST